MGHTRCHTLVTRVGFLKLILKNVLKLFIINPKVIALAFTFNYLLVRAFAKITNLRP